ncbi:MAG TPA: molybdopterin-dependent oxidoreductase [Roseiarcus sp.]|nr:molybdopterin-dependent oxidoreductase [Roseiarcus sp.]
MQSSAPAAVRTTCPYCGVGCGIRAKIGADGVLSLRGDPDHPANSGRLCSKGAALIETIDLDERLLHPEIGGRRASWDEALDLVASTFSQTIAAHGPDSVAFYVSGQLLTEDYYVANKLMKGFIGSANIDTNSRLCMSSAVAGHRRAFGADTVPGTYEDLDLADLIVLVGSNLAWCHPVLHQRIVAAKALRPEMRIVAIDPRRTVTADLADLHLPIRADGDVALFAGLLASLVDQGAAALDYIALHTTGFEDALVAARAMSPKDLAAQTGLTAGQLAAFYQLFARTEKTVTVYSQGVNQSSSGADKVNAIINCHLATGRIGKPGSGPFSVTGQPNAMGGREVGGLANTLAAHMDIENPDHRDRVRRFWRSPTIAERPGLKAVEMFRALAEKRIKAIWIMATNPVDSLPEAGAVEEALKNCPFVVVSDVSSKTDTMRFADVALPAAAWGEKDGAVTNSERRISRQRAFLPVPGEARPDWRTICDVAARMGFAEAFSYASPAAIFAEHAALSAFENGGSRDFDIGAFADLDDKQYEAMAPVQWPRPAKDAPLESRFFGAGGYFTPDRKARFVTIVPTAETRVSRDYPFVLNTGRARDHWHTMTRTGKSARLSQHLGEPFVEIHPADARLLGVSDADVVRVSTAGQQILVRALLSERQTRGAVFVPIHWTDQYAAAARVGRLVPGRIDPHSGQPASKHAPVRVERFPAARYGFAVLRERPPPLDVEYWALAKCAGGWRVELAAAEADRDWPAFAEQLFQEAPEAGTLAYHDLSAGQQRFASFMDDRLVGALFLAEEPVAVSRNWAVDQLSASFASRSVRLSVIAGRPCRGLVDRGATVCSCFGIGANQIAAAVAAGCASVEDIGETTRAGTSCGSCRAEIKAIIERQRLQAAE